MLIYSRDDTVNAGYCIGEIPYKKNFAYFFLASAIHSGSLKAIIRRLKNIKYDTSSMKRAIIMSYPGDKVFVRYNSKDRYIFDRNIDFVKKLYKNAGIQTGRIVKYTGNTYGRIYKESKKYCISTIIYDKLLDLIYNNSKLYNAISILNNKELAMEYLREHKIDVPRSIKLKKNSDRKTILKSIKYIGLPCYVKALRGGGGFGVWKAETELEAEELIKGLKHDVQIQEYIKGKDAINIQYLILPEKIKRLIITKQRIENERYHMGNDWPAEYRNLDYADSIAEVCRKIGFMGVLGLDLKEKLIEINARQNSSGEMPIILNKIEKIEKMSIIIRLNKQTELLEDIGDDKLWFNGREGILPFEWMDRKGEMAVAIINDLNGNYEKKIKRICRSV